MSIFSCRASLLEFMILMGGEANFWLLTFIPCFLQAIGTIAQFICLTLTGPPTYLILFHIRFVFQAIIDELVLSRPVTTKQWASLGLVAVGVGCKLIHFNSQLQPTLISSHATPMVLFQVMVESGAYCFVSLKLKTKLERSVQRIVYSINTLIIFSLVFTFNVNSSVDYFTPLTQLPVILLILHMAIMGICDDLTEKGILISNFSSFVQLISSCSLSFLVFNLDIDTQTTISVFLIWLFFNCYST